MSSLNKLYRDLLNENYITDFESLKQTLSTFPYYCNVTKIAHTSYYKINSTNNSIKTTEDEESIIDYFDNFIINKDNIYEFFNFSKVKYLLDKNNINNIKNYKMKIGYDYLKFYIFYTDRWHITSYGYEDISSPFEKVIFEVYTLYELVIKYFEIFHVRFNKLNSNYNYVFGLVCNDTRLLINDCLFSKLTLLNITSKKNHENIPITLHEIRKISKYLTYEPEISFFNKEQLINFLDKNKTYAKLNIQVDNLHYVINLEQYKTKRVLLDKIIQEPIKLFLLYHETNGIDYLKTLFPKLELYIENYKLKIKNTVKYYLKMYVDEKINKKTDLSYQKYDKEIIKKIHDLFKRHRTPVDENDIFYVIKNLRSHKLIEIFGRM